MNTHHQLTVIEKMYEFILWLFPRVNKFPKSQRFVLGQQIENTALSVLTGMLEANAEHEKRAHLKRVSVQIDTLRFLIRLARDLKFLTARQYGFASEQIDEVGRLLGGWMKRYA